MLVIEERKKSEYQEEKPLDAEKTTDKLNPHLTQSLVIEPGPHYWETSVLTIASSLLPEAAKSLKETNFLLQYQSRIKRQHFEAKRVTR